MIRRVAGARFAGALAGSSRAQRSALRPSVVLAAVLLGAALLRLVGLTAIERPYFDEKYYVIQAQERVDDLEPEDRPAHPPLGTWLIAGGILALGDDPLGWRVVPALAGLGSVVLTYAVAQAAWGRRWWSIAAAALVALDGLAVVTSRIAILDGLQVPFALAAVYALLRWRGDPERWRWPLLAGVAIGAMTAIKWNGLMLLPLAGLFFLLVGGPWRRRVGQLAALGAVGAAVYVGSYATWFVDYEDTETYADRCEDGHCGTGATDRIASWGWEQAERADFHRRLPATHPDRSSAATWPVMSEPVTIYLSRCKSPLPPGSECPFDEDESRQIIAVGNPALWWLGFAAAIPLLAVAVKRRDLGAALPALGLGALYLPWFASPKAGYFYFLTPAVPFLALVLVRAIALLPTRAARVVGGVVAVAFVGLALWLAPIHFAIPIDDQQLDARSLLPGWKP